MFLADGFIIVIYYPLMIHMDPSDGDVIVNVDIVVSQDNTNDHALSSRSPPSSMA
jgi:hypothetical protein